MPKLQKERQKVCKECAEGKTIALRAHEEIGAYFSKMATK